jgi:hypothetical protein
MGEKQIAIQVAYLSCVKNMMHSQKRILWLLNVPDGTYYKANDLEYH